ncbi:hypothetical protein K2Q16_01280 [Patescibacteria group bacterium]|nr:hypothetical protein [Patescibacteria group bacterium]
MLQMLSLRTFIALLAGLIVGALTSAVLLPVFGYDRPYLFSDTHEHSEEYHTHADFLIVINDTKIDLSDKEYMSVAERILHAGVHLHDGNGKVIHFHAPHITLVEFLSSLGITLTSDCITIQNKLNCTGEETELLLYVNEEERTSELLTYVPNDEDRVLLYLGDPNNPSLSSYLDAVTDTSCIYSGTCPERGTAPAESCGLTCEL